MSNENNLPNNAQGVHGKIHAVMAKLSELGIGKEGYNEQQKYKFRGMDQILNTVSPVMVEVGLLSLPNLKICHRGEIITKSGTKFVHIIVEGTYRLTDKDDGSYLEVNVIGEGADTMDKAANKAMTAAFKYMIIQTFVVPLVGNDDPELHSMAEGDAPIETLSKSEITALQVAFDDINGMNIGDDLEEKVWCQWLCEVDKFDQIPANQIVRAGNALAAIRNKRTREGERNAAS